MFRLMLALLAALLPMPSAAGEAVREAAPPCHEAMAADAGMAGHHAPAPQAPAAPHQGEPHCIGCIAPATVQPPAVTAPALAVRPQLTARSAPGIARGSPAPATPPPRSGA
ncbi:hypothetical protein ACFQ1E_08370 [Sphingomonas canadensis]|uniref:DUF2946 domain-containing protein n=1 Tax=Sphingomonas canadensis TaxID=1219257 RepID=A0ABW3H4G9_9SPHN|nr:hypothetical protein [Sphingomonas canadensis]MCW3836052.1 hypothetical protein [Sphingomonas canadensis]